MRQDEYAKLSARTISDMVRLRTISPVEITKAAIERTEKCNPSLNAVIFTDFEAAISRAKDLESRIMKGEDVGILAGVPTYMKDLFDFKPGWPATLGGIRALRDFVPDFYSHYPERMEKAGAIVLGKSNSATMGFSGTTDNFLFGPTRNPFDHSRNSGGSSGGVATVAASIVPIAEGSDGGGSIRIPAAWSGAVGFQPSFGRIPVVMRPNAFGATAPFVYEGPMAREVADIALSMNVLACFNPADPHSIETTMDFREATTRSLSGLRIGFSEDFGIFPVDREIRRTISAAVKTFENAGAHVENLDLKIPFSAIEIGELWCRMIAGGSFSVLEHFRTNGLDILKDHPEDLPPLLVHWIQVAKEMKLPELQKDQIMRTVLFDAFAAAFQNYDLIVSPTTTCMPVHNAKKDTMGPALLEGKALEPRIGWALTCFTNFNGHPAASVPAGLIDGMPVGMQIMGRRRADDMVIAACAEFERQQPWMKIYEGPRELLAAA